MPEAAATPPRIVDAPLAPPTSESGLLGVFKKRYLLRLLVQREIAARYQGSFLGLLWSYINPLTQFLIYFFIIGTIFDLRDQIENFAVHMFSALIVVHYFNETFNGGTRSIVRNKALVRKMSMPREMFPVASMLVSLYHMFPQLVILLIACQFYDYTPTLASLGAFLLGLSIIVVLGTGLALMFSAANVYFRDFGSVVSIVTNLVRFSVPMIYSYEMVTDRFGVVADYYLLNPIADAVILMQQAFWVGTTKDPELTMSDKMPSGLMQSSFIALGVSLVVLLVAQLIFSRLQDNIPERLN
jgi:ABC-2 type transport system permease protein